MNCSHSLAYRPFLIGPPLCIICSPPKRMPRKAGLLLSNGQILSKKDITNSIPARNREFTEQEALNLLEPYFGPMTVINPTRSVSFKPQKKGTFRLIGEIFPPKPVSEVPEALKPRPGSPNWPVRPREEIEAAQEEYVDYLLSQMEKAKADDKKFSAPDSPALRKAKWRFKCIMKERAEAEKRKKGRKRSGKYKLKGDFE